MREQEQIEEMANYYCEYCKKQTGEKFCEHIDDKSCNIFFEAELFYNAGYRKSEEVRKETAKEILDEIDNALHDLAMAYADKGHKDYYAVCEYVHLKVISKITKKYGVEVEE